MNLETKKNLIKQIVDSIKADDTSAAMGDLLLKMETLEPTMRKHRQGEVYWVGYGAAISDVRNLILGDKVDELPI